MATMLGAGLPHKGSPRGAQGRTCSQVSRLFVARMLVGRMANGLGKKLTLMVLDISCAFLLSKVAKMLYIELPKKSGQGGGGGEVGTLEGALYGTRDAPQAWLEEVSGTMAEIGSGRVGCPPECIEMRRWRWEWSPAA